jgi:hypothetical protein
MTANKKFKDAVRRRMEQTGERYAEAARKITEERQMTTPTPDVHYAAQTGAPTAACGADLHVEGATYRTFPDGITCTACAANIPAPDPTV